MKLDRRLDAVHRVRSADERRCHGPRVADCEAPIPGALALLSACAVAFLLDRSPMNYRVGARGSTAFVVHLASAALFGGFWGGIITGVSTALQRESAATGIREQALFNTAQRVLCVVAGALLYQVVLGRWHASQPSSSAGDAASGGRSARPVPLLCAGRRLCACSTRCLLQSWSRSRTSVRSAKYGTSTPAASLATILVPAFSLP